VHCWIGSLTAATSWKPMEKVTDCDKPEMDLVGNLHHGRTQSSNNAKNTRITRLTKKLKLRYL